MRNHTPLLLTGLCLAMLSPAAADVRLPAIFGDRMVLQQEARLPVWGWADPGEKISVRLGENQAETTAGADGKWRVDLPPVPAGSPARELIVAGENTLVFKDVLIGEVWLCSGQSNMEWRLKDAHNGKEAIQQSKDDQLRIFKATIRQALTPLDEVEGSWEICSSATVSQFSAIGYFFGKELRTGFKRPVGLIQSACGGTSAQAWTSLPAVEKSPELAPYLANFKAFAAQFPGGQTDYEARLLAQREWTQTVNADPAYQAAIKQWNTETKNARDSGQPRPPRPEPPIPAPPRVQVNGQNPALFFNGMLHPLIPYAIKGALWFQGEGNTTDAERYQFLLPVMIADWRARWGQGDFPFLIGQLCNSGDLAATPPAKSKWARLRESQWRTLSLPNTDVIVTLDLDPTGGVHFLNKLTVGERFALSARRLAYGEKIVSRGPVFDSVKTEGNRIRVLFKGDSLAGGLKIGAPPWLPPKATAPSASKLQGFAIAGEDQKWMWAEAKIEGDTVLVSHPDIPNPMAVRYGWADNPPNNLYNQADLPAAPFRSDSRELTSSISK